MDNLINLHLTNTRNVGDEYSAPYHYFPIPKRDHITGDKYDDYIIYGGGAVANGAVRHIKKIRNKGKKVTGFIWGVGSTQRNRHVPPAQPDYNDFKLVGVRDVNNKNKNVTWVPCASCMSEYFDDIPEPTQEVVFYGHKALNPMKEMNNDNMNFKNVIKHLSKGETIVTSSYHGVYWGTLLGRKVICIPFGSKFYGFKHKPLLVNKYQNQTGYQYPEALEECRNANIEFWKKIQCVIS